MSELYCPYCGAQAVLEDSKVIYGRSYGLVYLCSNYPTCDAYVGTHKGTDDPLGTLANKELRKWRNMAHAQFDKLWKSYRYDRKDAYTLLQNLMNLPSEKAHIGMFDIEQCQLLLKKLEEVKEI